MNAVTELKIEKGVPMPAARSRYPFSQMAPGDSFVSNTSSSAHAAWSYGKKHGIKFACRSVGDGNFRIWRIA